MMRKLKIEMKTRGLWARLAAFMVVLMMTTAQVNAQIPTVSEDLESTYQPTNIVNGTFDTRPFESFKYNGTIYFSFPGEIFFGNDNYITESYPNGVGKGWNSTETKIYNGSLFEWTNVISSYGLPSSNGFFIEMNAHNNAVLYQDLKTNGKDVIRWSLSHGFRTYTGPQRIRVEVGEPNGTATGIGINVNTNIKPGTCAKYQKNGVTNPTGKTYGYAGSLANLEVSTNGWHYADGIYVVPENQSTTRFAFIAEQPTNGDGNLLDDITFSTLIGNLKAVPNNDGSATVTGYWGDKDTDKKLVVKIGETTLNLTMSDVLEKNFTVTIPASTIGDAAILEVYHQDYEQAKRTVVITNHRHCICGDENCDGTGEGHQMIEWVKWTSANSLPNTAGNWFLTNDVTLTETYQPVDGINLCLNGHTVNTTVAGINMILISNDNNFALTDCQENVGKITTNGLNCGINQAPINNAGTFKFYNGSVQDCVTRDCSGGISNAGTGTVYMYGGIVSNCVVTKNGGYARGGGVFNSGTFYMKGGVITGCRSERWGGGVMNFSGGTFRMSGGEIRNNTGDGIYCGNIYLTGGIITGNTGNGVTARNVDGWSCAITVGGGMKVVGNSGSNVYLWGALANISNDVPFTEGACIGVTQSGTPTIGNPVAVTSNGAASDVKYFKSDKESYITIYNDSKVKLAVKGDNVVQVIETGIMYTTVEEAIGAATNGQTVQLVKNTDLTAALDIVNGKNFTLDLNGYRLRQTAENTRVMKINSGATITITDSRPDGETHYFTVGTTYVDGDVKNPVQQWTLNTEATSGTDWKTLTARPVTGDIIAVKGGIITGGYANNKAHGGCINNDGTVNMNAGIIVGNTADGCGGGIYSGYGATTICGTAALIGNSANQGGASYNGRQYGTCGAFTMTGNSRVSFNTTRHEGGGVWARRVTTFSGNSEISYNSTVIKYGDGGGVFAFSNEGHFTFSDNVLIANNYSAWNGGGIIVKTLDISITGAKIINNGCGNFGGGVFYESAAGPMTIGGTLNITGNKKGSDDNNLYLQKKTVTVSTLTEDANIGVTTATAPTAGNPVAVTGNNSASVKQYFTSDNKNLIVIENADKAVQLAVPVAQIVGGEKYLTVQEAINAATANQTVQMIANSTENVTVGVGKDITFDLNGKTLKSTTGNTITVNGTLNITDTNTTVGEVVATSGNSIVAEAGTTNITKGKFNGEISKSDDATLTIEGGKYSNDPTKYLDFDHAAKDITESPYVYEVVTGDEIVCNDGTHSFTTLQHAIDFQPTPAAELAEITLSKDINECLTIADDKDITLDLKGKTITSANGNTVITNNGTLTVIDSSEAKTGTITGATEVAGIQNNSTGTLNLYAGNITGNATGVDNNGILTLGGTTKITLNGPVEARKDLYLPNEKTFSIVTGTYAPTTMNIGITTQTAPSSGNDITLTGENGKDYSQHFFGDDSRYSVINTEGNVLKLTNEVKIIISAEPVEGGEVKIYDNKNGKYLDETERQHILYGTSVTIEATALNESGFAFAGWFNKVTGEYFSNTQTYTFDATKNLELEARFTDQVIWIRVKKGN